jgi:hypothetical protein
MASALRRLNDRAGLRSRPMTTRQVYDRQAEAYDTTRGASPSVLGPLRDALGGARVADARAAFGDAAVLAWVKTWAARWSSRGGAVK